MNLKLTVRPRISETSTKASMTLRRVTNLEFILYRMTRVILLQIAKVFWLNGGTTSLSCSI